MEAQRIISLSLGKIAQSRGRRTGVDLHKNLLVSTVLHRAKNVILLENYTNSVKSRPKLQEPIYIPDTSDNSDDSDISDDEGYAEETEMSCPRVDEVCEMDNNGEIDKENSPPVEDYSYEIMDLSKSQEYEKDTAENSSSCGGCLKRKRDHSDSVNSDSNVPRKIAKSDSISSQNSVQQSQSDNGSQISTLVNIFNTGFSGLTNSNLASSTNQNTCASTSYMSKIDTISIPIAMAMAV